MNRRHSVREPIGLKEKGVKQFRVSWFLELKEGLECRGYHFKVTVSSLQCFLSAGP